MAIKDYYENLSPSAKKLVLWGGGGFVLIVLLYLVTTPPNDPYAVQQENAKPTDSLITTGDIEGVSQESISATLRRIEHEQDKVLLRLDDSKKEIESLGEKQKELVAENTSLKQQLKEVYEAAKAPVVVTTPNNDDNQKNRLKTIYDQQGEETLPYSKNEKSNDSDDDSQKGTSSSEYYDPDTKKIIYPDIVNTGEVTDEIDKQQSGNQSAIKDGTEKEDIAGSYLPAASIIPTVALSGMDAPTAKQARQNPYPMLLRIKKEAILPNGFYADIKECGMLAAGFGELSSERTYLRTNTITCIREDGAVFESNLDAFAVGEDGKAGVRGRLVTKQGQYLAKALVAGFLQAGSEMFSVNEIPTITVGSLNDTRINQSQPYQQINSNRLQGAAMKGFGGALNRLADFYMDMAQDLFPVIEIDPARRIDFVVTKGVQLKFTKTN